MDFKKMRSITEKECRLFNRMLSYKAASFVTLYLNHEEKVLVDFLSNVEDVEGVVVVGAGPLLHLDTILAHQKKYIGIDPCLSVPAIIGNKIMTLNSFFESIKRDQLPEGRLVFMFCFNVLFYLDNPEEHINRVLRQGDIVIISQWSGTECAASLMKKYFNYVYRNENVDSYEIIDNILRFNISLPTLQLSRVEKTENEVNLITVGYFD